MATAVLITASVASFATLGDEGKKGRKPITPSTFTFNTKAFTLRSGYNFKSNNLFTQVPQKRYIMLNNVVSFQKGNSTYVMPLKKKVLLDKIKFNPAP